MSGTDREIVHSWLFTKESDLRFSRSTITVFGRLIRSERRLIDRRNASGMRENLAASGGAFRSGRKKFFTANIVISDGCSSSSVDKSLGAASDLPRLSGIFTLVYSWNVTVHGARRYLD